MMALGRRVPEDICWLILHWYRLGLGYLQKFGSLRVPGLPLKLDGLYVPKNGTRLQGKLIFAENFALREMSSVFLKVTS